jgi:hypothetical protein
MLPGMYGGMGGMDMAQLQKLAAQVGTPSSTQPAGVPLSSS